jgi:hypothetical protein
MKTKHKKHQTSLSNTLRQWPDSFANISNHRISHAIYKIEDRLLMLRFRIMSLAQSAGTEAKNFSKRAKNQFSLY